ncbi:GNAT family N-acetyltransferase [Pelomonas sp. CA6]|uniref:GNAT family N-acetyltransferase n=1 Tax=Pelomonas sp. CA6 TaxID=2907999 RepID=UPI001F4BF87C|nr:GNAT family N-acetyltransferase [Pelomonas sp. CA6]MCH7343921.1 GNAT family N-acetyltransferase [Pelomonas sp. CA6]
MLSWSCERLEGLGSLEVFELLKLRAMVFVSEQRCIYQDPDDTDPEAWHLRGRDAQGRLAAYARLYRDARVGPKIGRVLTAPWARGAGQGRALMHQALRDCARLWPGEAVTLSAQAHLQHFYAALGFAAISEVYDEDGIPHIDMRRPAA